jgi:hypothetical protein
MPDNVSAEACVSDDCIPSGLDLLGILFAVGAVDDEMDGLAELVGELQIENFPIFI